ncbi:hypothetical protein ACFLRY_00790 [Bacteroidota bacterium]
MKEKTLGILRIVAIVLIIITAVAYYLSFDYAWIFAVLALIIMAFFVLPDSIKKTRRK